MHRKGFCVWPHTPLKWEKSDRQYIHVIQSIQYEGIVLTRDIWMKIQANNFQVNFSDW